MVQPTPTPSRQRTNRSTTQPRQRRGIIIVLAAVLMVTMMSLLAFSIDVGYIMTVRTELQRAVDAGALAGAGMLVQGSTQADTAVREYIQKNTVGNQQVKDADITVETGHWDNASETFTPSNQLPSAVRVRAVRNGQGLFFGPVMGTDTFDVDIQAIAMYRPRDIMLVLDYSASMNDDSELRKISSIGQAQVEANLQQIYQELGSPSFGTMQWDPVYISSTDTTVIINTLGLDDVPYPFPSGSWSDYISYVQSSEYINSAGYQQRYGYLTLTNYWLERRPKSSETPDLWMTSEQPITAVKNAVTVFLAYLQEVDTDDQLGLAIYNSTSQAGLLESGLTSNFQSVEDLSRQRQAGHYDYYTNIGGGLQEARLELENSDPDNGGRARPGAFKMIVLMTDGIANRPSSTSTAKQFLLDEAQLCADNRFPIVAISLGSGADTSIMQQVADITGGQHFNIPGGQPVASFEQDLKDVFRQIADDRPLKLVQ